MMVQDTVTIRISNVVADPITYVRTVSVIFNSMNLLCAQQHQTKTISLITSFYGQVGFANPIPIVSVTQQYAFASCITTIQD
jgi:hypothetical protein